MADIKTVSIFGATGMTGVAVTHKAILAGQYKT